MAGRLGILLLLLMVSTAGAGQICLNVNDKNGETVSGLQAGAFETRIDGTPVVIDHVRAAAPLSVVLLLDVSQPVIPYQDTLRRALDRFVGVLRSEDQVAVLVFGDSTSRVFPFSRDHLETRRKILSHHIQGAYPDKAKLWDGLADAVELAGPHPGRRAVVAFTHGNDVGSETRPSEVLDAAERGGVRLDVIHTPRPIGWSGGYWRQQISELQGLVADTGGEIHSVSEPEEFFSTYETVAGRLISSYCLAVEVPSGKGPGPHKVRVRVNQKGAKVLAPGKYNELGADSSPD